MAVQLAGASISEWGRPGRLGERADPLAVSTFSDLPYAVPNYLLRWTPLVAHVPVGTWRSVGQSHNGFFLECAMDELAHAAGRDALDFRLELLAERPRHQAVLRAAAARAGWGRSLPADEGMGIALVEDQASAVAQVVRVRVRDSRLEVLDESWQHEGHAGANGTGFGTHFRVRVAAPAFDGLRRVARHRLVYDALADFLAERGVHALAIEADD